MAKRVIVLALFWAVVALPSQGAVTLGTAHMLAIRGGCNGSCQKTVNCRDTSCTTSPCGYCSDNTKETVVCEFDMHTPPHFCERGDTKLNGCGGVYGNGTCLDHVCNNAEALGTEGCNLYPGSKLNDLCPKEGG